MVAYSAQRVDLLKNETNRALFKEREVPLTSLDLVEEKTKWSTIQQSIQQFPAGFAFKVKANRESEVTEAEGITAAMDNSFLHTRGVMLTMMKENFILSNHPEDQRLHSSSQHSI